MGPLSDLTIVEVGQVVSAPFAGMMFADMGAEVIKIERVETGDPMRHPTPGSYSVGNFEALNRGKKSVELNLKTDEGKEVFRDVASDADFLIENLSPGAFQRLDLPLGALVEANESLVVGRIKGFGSGPYEHRLGMDHPVEVESGMTYMTGLEGQPLRVGFSVVDISTAMQIVIGALATLRNLPLEPQSRIFTVGMFETASLLMSQPLSKVMLDGENPIPINETTFRWAVYDYFNTKDGRKIFLGLTSDEQWDRFCEEFDLTGWLDESDLQDESGRVENRDRIQSRIQEIISAYTQVEIAEIFNELRVTYAPLQVPRDLFDDEHLQRDGKMVTAFDGTSEYRFPNLPHEGGLFPAHSDVNIPRLGEHSKEYLQSIGYSSDEIDTLIERGVIGGGDS